MPLPVYQKRSGRKPAIALTQVQTFRFESHNKAQWQQKHTSSILKRKSTKFHILRPIVCIFKVKALPLGTFYRKSKNKPTHL